MKNTGCGQLLSVRKGVHMIATSSWARWALACSGLITACGTKAPSGGAAGDPYQSIARTAFSISRVEKVDMLFVVDNSNSMAGEQASLRAQLPHLTDVLTRGKRSQDDPHPFTPVRDLHVGVVSTDMGISGVEFPSGNCHADGGDDGHLGLDDEDVVPVRSFLSGIPCLRSG